MWSRFCVPVVCFIVVFQWTRVQGNIWTSKADVVFVLDASDTVGPAAYEALKAAIVQLVQQWTIATDNIQVGVVSYGNGSHNEFFINEAPYTSLLEERLKAIAFRGGTADAADAIRFAAQTSFSSENGARSGVPHIIIHISDGPSANTAALLEAAQAARDNGTIIFNVGIGEGVQFDQLAKVASDPSNRYVLLADSYSSLTGLVPTLASRVNNEIPVSSHELPTRTGCLTQADLVLLVDSSSSVGQEDFEHLEDFVKDLVVQLAIDPDQVQLGLVQFAGHPSLEFPLNLYTDRMAVLKAVETLQFMGGGTNTGDAIHYVTTNLFTKDGGARTDVPRVVVVITDGQSVDPSKTLWAAEDARQNGINLIAVGVGSNIDDVQIYNIADNPDSEFAFRAPSYRNLTRLSSAILNAACQFTAQVTAKPTLEIGVSTTEDPCHDLLDNCHDFSQDTCTEYRPWARRNCNKRCGFCHTLQEAKCENLVNDCESYGSDVCTLTQYKQWAYTNCKRFCGFCDSSVPTLGFYGRCMYKGVEYTQSERWEDGCDYECVCENAIQGQYRCYNKCPVYHDLPRECTLVGVPGQCCLQPVCNFNQQITTSLVANGPHFTEQHIPVCEHDGKQYYQDQTWEVGCSQKCVCVNSTLGAYRCQSYCPQYSSLLHQHCRMVQKPGSCCEEPVCEFNTQTGSFTGFGTLSGRGTEMARQPRPVCADAVVDCEAYGSSACTEYPSWARVNCFKFCGFCAPDSLTPGANDTCYFNGKRHAEGDRWKGGCSTDCMCEDGVYGYYRCYNSCPTYMNLPNGCTLKQVVGSCCPVVECVYGTFYSSSTNVFSIGNGGGLIALNPNGSTVEVVPTFTSGSTLPPGTWGGATGLANIKLEGCLFNGRMFLQDQIWHSGCALTCACQDASYGLISCRERCPRYNNVPEGCTTVPDTSDPCCTVPSCPPTISYVAIPVYGKGTQTVGQVMSPSLGQLVSGVYTASYTVIYSAFTVASPTVPLDTLRPGGLDYCEYKGRRYAHGEQWEDGCDYNCVCEDASTGTWRCVEKCEQYVEIPLVYCHLERDPANPCCMRPVCNFQIAHGEIAGNNTLPTTTLAPTTPHYFEPECVYKGVRYAVGQIWYDGCDLQCRCDNADANIFTCVSRCPSFPPEYDGCQQVPDPDDTACCLVPLCNPTQAPYTTPYPGATLIPTLAPYLIPHIPPGVVTGGNSSGSCVYRGLQYQQGDRWDDGCSYSCVCQDAQNGVFQCTERCHRYGALPSDCRLVTDFTNPCCKVPVCSGTGIVISSTSLPGLSTPVPPTFCQYNNAVFLQGQVWEEGCSKVCRCEDASNGLYVCSDRCPSYILPAECTLVADASDPCCLTPRCVPSLQPGTTLPPNPELIPTLAPGKITGSATFPTPTPGPNGEVTGINYCIYKGMPYRRGERWQDRCSYNCECMDVTVGRYECTERCTRYAVLPPSCVMVRDAADYCCQVPVCSPDFSTPFPTQIGTPLPGSTLAPSVSPSISYPTPPRAASCIYKNDRYTQGQMWFDGCDYSCVCENAQSGIYRCIERCPRFTSLPAECTLGPDPADPVCCKRPMCEYVPTANTTSGYLKPPINPGVVTGGSVTPQPLPYYTPTPGPDGSTLEPPRRRYVCFYKGQEYTQGQKWADGCQYDCECVNAEAGAYRCTEKCLRWSSIPDQCSLVSDPGNPCCQLVYCDPMKPTPDPVTTVSPIPGTTPDPFIGPNGNILTPPTFTTPAPPRNRCVYNGVPYSTGEKWDVGCDLKCVCEDGPANIYRCSQRCYTYQLPANCILTTDLGDACCQVPYCSPVPLTTLVPEPVTGPDGSTLAPPRNTSVLVPTSIPGTIIGTSSGHNGSSACVFNGVTYAQGEHWDDGCNMKCACLNGTAGVYQCSQRCMTYLNVPPNCWMATDPVDSCCKTPLCQAVTEAPSPSSQGTTAAPLPGQTTLAPEPVDLTTLQPKKKCSVSGQYYAEGQLWYDACDKVCVCVDGETNYYTCSDRCARYTNLPSQCQLVASPDDPACCQVPQCVPTPGPFGYTTPDPSLTPLPTVFTNPPGVITGIAPTPTTRPGFPTPQPRGACVYKGREYNEGQQWQDGCNYLCTCLNETSGLYRCQQRCPIYPVVPHQCWRVPDPNDFCCQLLQCDFSQPTPDPFSPTPGPTRMPDPNLHTTMTPTPGDTTLDIIPTPSYKPPTIAPEFTYCLYNGIAYKQGVSWNVGCEKTCVCEDSARNYYACADRCPSYPSLPSTCSYVVDPHDACCQVPSCYLTPTLAPGTVPGQVPDHTTSAPPLPLPTGVPGVIIGRPNTGITTVEKGCIRDGTLYSPGETWQVGCRYNCVCLDTEGTYKCTERCTPYPVVPSYCTMMTDPDNNCCEIPVCPQLVTLTPVPHTTLTPVPGVSEAVSTPSFTPGETPQPTLPNYPLPKEVCVYSGRSYTEGQIWYDGCAKSCICEDGKTGFYRCSNRCASYPPSLATCQLVPDLQDPTCCQVPQCQDPSLLNVTGHIGSITGYGRPPTPLPPTGITLVPPTLEPGVLLTPAPATDVCVYNGRAYSQGQMWLDGCNYNCQCVNASVGEYLCTDRCPRYPQNIASYCVMLRNPQDLCCMVPDCSVTPDQPGATPGPTMAPPFPTLHPTLAPGRAFCVYKGIPYSHGQTWYDGCDLNCRCEDVVTGQVNCDVRCLQYAQIPAGCTLVTDPKDSCCQVPVCSPQPGQNNTLTITGPIGTITGSSLPPNHNGPLTRKDVCIYHGREYHQAEVWDDGCTYTCACVDSSTGRYLCTEKCRRFVNMPPTCTMIKDPDNPCCLLPYCLPWPPRVPTPQPDVTPTWAPGVSFTSPAVTVPTVTTPAPVGACVYKGAAYRQSQQWYDGCSALCSCDNATVGFYRCQQRCQSYSPGPDCRMVPDPKDPTCCEIPQCPLVTPTPDPSASPTPGIISVTGLPPGTIVGVGQLPTPLPQTVVTSADGSTISPTPLPRTGCYYKGVVYQESQTWDDRCDFRCQCVDGINGRYMCSAKCPILPDLPRDRCTLVLDPQEPCCMTPYCDFVHSTPFPDGTPTPYPPYLTPGPEHVSTLVPPHTLSPYGTPTPWPTGAPEAKCVYNGAYYGQGESWPIGCDLLCVCTDPLSGSYTCNERCKTFGTMLDGCELRVDPSDACCLVPYCLKPPVTITPMPPTIVTGGSTLAPSYIMVGVIHGSFTGTSGLGHPPTGGFGIISGFTNGCLYKSTVHQQGELWEDGCNFLCVCTDALRGRYTCSDRCASFHFLPPTCILEQAPDDSCCQQARCYPGGLTLAPGATATSEVITGITGTGPHGSGATVVVDGNVTSFTATGTTIQITAETPTGFIGTGSTIQITPETPTGFIGTGSTIQITAETPTGFIGTGSTAQITAETPTGFTGTGSTVSPLTGPGFNGTGSPVTVNPQTPTGFTGSGTNTTANPQGTVTSFTGSTGACIYKGIEYHTGDRWQDGCDLSCECTDQTRAYYVCTYRCPVYSSLPQYCHLQLDISDICCKKPLCTYQGTTLVPQIGGTPTISPTLEPSITNVVPLGTHTVIYGSSRLPGTAILVIYGGRSSCIYKGVVYIPGESWDDGCDYTCTCLGDDVGYYRCVSKCPSYPPLPRYCSLNNVPGMCCPSLSCDIPNVGTYNPIPQLEPSLKPTAGPSGLYPTPQPILDPQLILGSMDNVTGGSGLPGGGYPVPSGYLHNLGGITDKCIYDLKIYNQGEVWHINCTYTCHCYDSRTGYYSCTERCPSYDTSAFPSTCTMVQDPRDACCLTPSCPNPNNPNELITNITQIQQLYPIVGHYSGGISGFRPGWIPTGVYAGMGGIRNGCAYKGTLHAQGEHWEDGCDFDCVCIDGTIGMYQCTTKCTTYPILPSMCRLEKVQGQCCMSVHCDPITTPAPQCRDKIDNCYQYRQQACVGAYESWAREHCPLFCGFCVPDYTTTPAPCVDVLDNCVQFGHDVCTSVAYEDWVMSNCRKFCDRCGTTTVSTTVWTTPESGCFDAVNYCQQYGLNVCSDIMYKSWALTNCPRFCGFCGTTVEGSTTPEPCTDVLGEEMCRLYGQQSCGGQFFGWARANCRKFCGLCDQLTQATDTTLFTSPATCVDQRTDCAAYGEQYCGGDYLAWAADNCALFCNLCNYEVTTVKVVVDNGWLVLMKGVAGIPGTDLWQLWSGTGTANGNVTRAQYLTNQFQGHYKPEITNQWNLCQFERVKVAIYTDGVEEANLIFDVRNLGKNEWFRPEGVVSSSFTDLPTNGSTFTLAPESNTGHEFAIGNFESCHGTGWLFVSTNRNCSYQTGTEPQFLYSLSNSEAHLNPGQLGHGDVFAILGQGGNCMSGVFTTKSSFTAENSGCFYKGETYHMGDTWQDGCEFNCTCQDTLGQYYCVQLCLSYQNLPPECSLEKQPGACCAELHCPYPTGDGCYYKNQTYAEGATWQDGCDFDCTCEDGRTGSYQCRAICQDWSHLPQTCHMEAPAPGLCCPRPVCPAPIVVDFKPR